MARRRKDQLRGGATAGSPWMITLTDLMTLLMTFFVVLVSLSSFDERSKHYALESVNSVFSPGEEVSPDPVDFTGLTAFTGLPGTEFTDEGRSGEHGHESDESLLNIRNLLLGEAPEIRLSQNSRELTLSFNSDLLFEPGGLALSARGRALLDKLVPYVTAMRHPMRIAGHGSSGQEEIDLSAGLERNRIAAAWTGSLERALAVYRHFLARGASPAQLAMEAHGDSRPRFSNDTPEGRLGNSRIDLVLDKRNPVFAGAAEALRESEEIKGDYYFKEFRFELEFPGREAEQGQPGGLRTSGRPGSSGTRAH